jgi:integrase
MFSATLSREPGCARVPSYRRHKPTGQAVVTLDGRDIYLGRWNSTQSRREYDRLIGEWLAAGRSLPRPTADLAIAELILRFMRFAGGYYRKNGGATSELEEYKQSLRPVRQLYGLTPAADFGPIALKAVRLKMVETNLSRGTINRRVNRIKRLFKWAVAEELLEPSVYQRLATVEGLRQGRTTAREPRPIAPVDDQVVDATLPHLPEVVADMVRFQRLTGCRPDEVCIVRPIDVDATGDVWRYRPESHKTEHLGRERIIFIGPKAQDVLRKYLLRDKECYCFAPTESERKRNALRREARQSPMTPSQQRRGRKRHPKRPAGCRYDVHSYRRAIHRAVDLANRKREQAADETAKPEAMPKWGPNRLRHSAATEIRKRFGLEAAQVALGHATADVSQIYAERDWSLAAEVMRKIG